MKLNYVRRFSAYVSTFYHSKYITLPSFPSLQVLPHIITICDGKADCADVQKISTVSKVQVYHYICH